MLDRKLLFIVCLVVFLLVPAVMAQTQDDIRQAQTALKAKGFDPGTPDGMMSQQTRTAIREFQRSSNLQVTGELNAETRRALGLGEASTSGQTGSQSGQTGATSGTMSGQSGTSGTMGQSDTTGSQVHRERRGRRNQSGTMGQTGGTTSGQATTGQDTTGQSSSTQGTTGTMSSSSETAGTTGRHAGRHSSERVREVQTALQGKGVDPGPIDGIMGPKTKAALRQFQQQNNLSVTGRIDSRTLAALNVSGAPGTEEGTTGRTRRGESSSLGTGSRGGRTGGAGTGTGGTEQNRGRGESSSLGITGSSSGPPSAGTTGTTRSTGSDQSANRMDTMGSTSNPSNTKSPQGGQSSTYGQSSSSSTQGSATMSSADTDKAHDQAELARKAGIVLQEMAQAPDKGIPNELLERAKGIAVIPNVIKGAFGIGGRWGEGLMAGRNPDGTWGAPSYVEISGASVGFQIGVSATDLVLVFTSKDAIDTLLKGKLHLGADAAVAAGPVGRAGSVGTDVKFNGPIYAYSRSKGVFAGVSLDGSAITIDDSANRKAYGKEVSGTDILENHAVQASAVVQPFMDAVRQHTPNMRAE